MLTTPGGKPASLIRSASLSAVRGVISEGWQIKISTKMIPLVSFKLDLTFKIVVLPVASAGPIFHATIAYIKCISRTLYVYVYINTPKESSTVWFVPNSNIWWEKTNIQSGDRRWTNHNAVWFISRVSKFILIGLLRMFSICLEARY